jgi:hypothetical protein
MHKALQNKEEKDGHTQVKLARSRAQTRLIFVFKGTPEQTEEKLQRIYKGVTG